MHPPKTCKVAFMDVEYMVTTSSPMETLNFKWKSHVYTHAAALSNIPTLWCDKQLTTWMAPCMEILIDESLYAAQYAAREAAISIMTKAGSQSSNVIKDQLEKHHAKLCSHDIFWSLTNNFWNACCGDQSNSRFQQEVLKCTPDPKATNVADQTVVWSHAKLQELAESFLMEFMGCIQSGKLDALIIVLKAIINGKAPTHINNGSEFDKIIQHRIGTWCVWPIENPKKRGKDAARLIYEHIKKRMAVQNPGRKY